MKLTMKKLREKLSKAWYELSADVDISDVIKLIDGYDNRIDEVLANQKQQETSDEPNQSSTS